MLWIDSLMAIFGFYRKPAVKTKKLRICLLCDKQIKRAERWRFVNKTPCHWDCQYPTDDPKKGPWLFKKEGEGDI